MYVGLGRWSGPAIYGIETSRKNCRLPLAGSTTEAILPIVTGGWGTGDQNDPAVTFVADCNWSSAAEPDQETTRFVPVRTAVSCTGPGTVRSWVIRVDQAAGPDGYI